MTVAGKIKEVLMSEADSVRVRDVRIGLIYTAVMLADERTGVAFTFSGELQRGNTRLRSLQPLSGRKAGELLDLLDSPHRVEAAVALATVNALSNTPGDGLREGDTLDFLKIAQGERVGMVGLFAPVLPRLRERTSSILIFEQVSEREGDLLPEEDAYSLLPGCGVALITSTSIVNQTIDRLLAAAQNCREVVLLGASTPLVPEPFAGTSVTLLSGVIVLEPEEILRRVSEAGGTRSFKGHVRKVNLRLVEKRTAECPMSNVQ